MILKTCNLFFHLKGQHVHSAPLLLPTLRSFFFRPRLRLLLTISGFRRLDLFVRLVYSLRFTLSLQVPASPCELQLNSHTNGVNFRPSFTLRLPNRRSSTDFASFAVQTSSELTSSVGFSPVIQQQPLLTQRHINVLSFFACVTAISATWLFCVAIPTLLAFKRAAESMEKLMDVAREELPDTMAAVRLSGMEIGDLTMELSDLGQGINQGVQSSTQAVRMAEEKLRQFTNSTPTDGGPNRNRKPEASSG